MKYRAPVIVGQVKLSCPPTEIVKQKIRWIIITQPLLKLKLTRQSKTLFWEAFVFTLNFFVILSKVVTATCVFPLIGKK